MAISGNKNNKLLGFINTAVFLLVIAANYLAVMLPLNGKTTGELSDQYPNKFTPAGFTFSIWGIIYLFLAIFIVYQLVGLRKNNLAANKIKAITPYFIINCLANATWLVAWHYEQVALSVFIMFVMLGTLMIIHEKLGLAFNWHNIVDKVCLDIPFSLYLGWISIATIANIAVLLVKLNVNPFGLSATVSTIIMLAIATVLTHFMVFKKNNVVFALVVCWALFGIISKRTQEATPGSADIILISWACMASIFIALVIMAIKTVRLKR